MCFCVVVVAAINNDSVENSVQGTHTHSVHYTKNRLNNLPKKKTKNDKSSHKVNGIGSMFFVSFNKSLAKRISLVKTK